MASSPPYSATSPSASFTAGSPPAPASRPLPNKRPSLGPPGPHSSAKRRKPSTAGPSHLRQTSFPPEGAPSFTARSPTSTAAGTPRYSRSPSVDTTSLVSGVTPSLASGVTGGKKRGRKSKAAQSLANGEHDGDGRSMTGDLRSNRGKATARGAAAEDDEAPDDEDEDDDAQLGDMVNASKMNEAREAQELQKQNVLLNALSPAEQDRFVAFRRANLHRPTVRKLVNQTLSQSVPQSIINVVNGYTKTFVGELLDIALDVQLEYTAAAKTQAERVPDTRAATVADVTLTDMDNLVQEKGLEGRDALKERLRVAKRGPLLPDHLREALRRYKRDSVGGAAGFMGFSGEGRENVAGRTGGRKLFR